MKLVRVRLDALHEYENNPRENDRAVDAVASSIRQVGYCAPIVVDEHMEILAGHTRFRALQKLGRTEVDVIVREGMTEQQKRKYRILDNKTGERSSWDRELLRQEMEDLDFGTDFDFGFDTLMPLPTKEEAVEDMDAQEDGLTPMERKTKVCTCPRCGRQFEDE